MNLALWGVAILVIFFLIIQVSDNLIRSERSRVGRRESEERFALPLGQFYVFEEDARLRQEWFRSRVAGWS